MRSAHIRHSRGAICPFILVWPAGSMSLIRGSAAPAADLTPIPRVIQGRVMDCETKTRQVGFEEKVPDWWPYAPEFPNWHVWRGVAGLLYARRPRSSPPKVVRGKSAVDLRDQIRLVEVRQ